MPSLRTARPLLCAAACLLTSLSLAQDRILVNGKIFTANPAQPYAEAVSIRDGKIAAVGNRHDVEASVGADAQVIKLFPHNNRLYMGGSFSNVNSLPATRIVFRTSCYNPCPCVADTDDGSGTGYCDGGVTIDDLLYYLQRFEAGC